ncbi:MAG: tetratricopeptide repeat protein [Nitrospirota bacterium]
MSDTTKNDPEGGSAVAQAEGAVPEELYREGARCLKARDYPSARASLEKYLEQRPDDPAALHLLARVLYYQNKDFDKAEGCLEKAARLDPDSLTCYLETQGILLIQQARYKEALEVFERALSEDKKADARHTAALKFYRDLVKKKGGASRPHHAGSGGPRNPFFTAEYGHRRMKAPYFVLPSLVVHALVLILASYLSTHSMPFKKNKTQTDFTYVQLSQPAGGASPSGAGSAGGSSQGTGAGQPAAGQSANPASGNPAAGQPEAGQPASAQPKMAKLEMGKIPAPAAPEINEEKSNGSPGTISSKSGAVVAIKPGEIAAVSVMPGRKELDIEDVKPKLSGGKVRLSEKSLTAPSGTKEKAEGEKYRATRLKYKASMLAGGTMALSGAMAGRGGPKWNRGRLAKLEEQGFQAAVPEEQTREEAVGLSNPSFRPAPDELKNLPARRLEIPVGGSRQGAQSSQFKGVESLTGMKEDISAYDKLQGELGVSMSSPGASGGAVASKERASLSQAMPNDLPGVLPGSDRRIASLDRLTGVRFASAKAPLPGRKTLNMPRYGAANPGSGTGGRSVKIRGISKKSSLPAGYASQGITSPGNGGYAGFSKGISGKTLGRSGSEGGLGGLLESASEKISGILGMGGRPAGLSGPSARDFRRGGVAGLAAGTRSGTGNSGGTGAYGRGAGGGGVRVGTAQRQSSWVSAVGGVQKQSSWVPKPTTGGSYGARADGITGGKLFAGGALGTPGGNRYASASRAGVTPMSVNRRSVIPRGTLIAENKIGPKVRIISPGSGFTDRISQTIRGVVSNTRIRNATLTVNNNSEVISVEGGRFDATVSLSKGTNIITVMAFDADGNVGKDSVKLDYSGSSAGAPVNIIYPKDGQVFDVSENCVITVKGTIGDQDISRAKLIFNGNPMDIAVNRGYFEQKVALMQEQNTLQVETTNSAGQTTHSQLVNVGTINVKPKDIMIILTWDKPHADFDLHVYSPSGGHTYYKQPNIYESRDAIPGGRLEQDAKGNFGPEVFDQGHAERGIYTVKSNYYYSGGDGDANAKVTIILYGDNPSRRIERVFGPHLQRDTKDGSDFWEVTRFKMPEGIFLEE